MFEVIVDNIGTVYSGDSYDEAVQQYDAYVGYMQDRRGNGAGPVTLMQDDDITQEWIPPEGY